MSEEKRFGRAEPVLNLFPVADLTLPGEEAPEAPAEEEEEEAEGAEGEAPEGEAPAEGEGGE